MYEFSITMLANTAVQQNQVKPMAGLNMLFVLFFVAAMYFLTIRPQKKKEKEAEQLRANIDIGDEIVTIGGIIGTVVSIKDDFIVIETGGDRNKIRINKWAIHSNNSAEERKQKELEVKSKIKEKK